MIDIACIFPSDTNDKVDFFEEVKRAFPSLESRIAHFNCDQSETDIFKNVRSVKAIIPFYNYIILGKSMSEEALTLYYSRFAGMRPLIRQDIVKPLVYHYDNTSGLYRNPERQLVDCFDYYFETTFDLLQDLHVGTRT